jgi:hypothetical protein
LETLLALGNISVTELAKSVLCSTHDAVMLKVKCLEIFLPHAIEDFLHCFLQNSALSTVYAAFGDTNPAGVF